MEKAESQVFLARIELLLYSVHDKFYKPKPGNRCATLTQTRQVSELSWVAILIILGGQLSSL